jgi:nicotinamidase-related amidase
MEKSKQKSALLVMDMQHSIVGRLADSSQLIIHVKKALAHAREKKLPIVYVVVGFRPGTPEISANNKSFVTYKTMLSSGNMDEMIKIHQDLAPLPNDITVIKRRVSAFTGSDLDVVLRSLEVQHLVLTGIATSGVVLSTVREAADKDFGLMVLSDCCADNDNEVHQVLMNKVFPRQADVISLDEWMRP